MKNITDLKQKRAGLVAEMRKILDKADKEGRDMTEAENTAYEQREADIAKHDKQIKRLEDLQRVENSLKEEDAPAPPPNTTPDEPKNKREDREKQEREKREEHHGAFLNYLRGGKDHPDWHKFANVLVVGTDSAGGYTVPEEWERRIIKALADLTFVRRRARVTTAGNDRNFPIRTGKPTFALIAENATYTTVEPTYNTLQITAYKIGGIIPISEELLQDSAVDMEAEIQAEAVEAFAEAEENLFINGTGSSQHQGLFTATAVAGVSISGITAASATTVTADEIIDTFYTLGRQYRRRAIWMMSDALTKIVRKLKDTTNQYLWQPGLREGEPDILLGRPVEVSSDIAAPASTVRSAMVGDLSYYRIIDRLGMTMKRLDQGANYGEKGLVGFRFHKRNDAEPTLAPAFATLTQAV